MEAGGGGGGGGGGSPRKFAEEKMTFKLDSFCCMSLIGTTFSELSGVLSLL